MYTDLVLFDVAQSPFNNIVYRTVKISNLKNYNSKNIVIIEGNSVNRDILERDNVNILLSPHKDLKRDSMHFRNSGLNQVLCSISKKNNIAIGFSFSEFLNSNDRALILGKMQQNVRLCRKFKVKMVIASFAKNEYELRSIETLKSFGYILGMNPEEIKKSTEQGYLIAKDKLYK
mgnify:CR=1 FL=1